MSRLLITLTATLVILTSGRAAAQYMYLDANGDGVWTPSDTLRVPGKTTIDIWLRTDRNRDGSVATCPSGQSLTLNSYSFLLEAIGGTVAWGTYTNDQPVMGIDLGETSTPTAHRAAFVGSTALTAGTYKLGTIDVLVTSGRPYLQIAVQDSVGGHPTAFGSACDGPDLDNTMTLGEEWTDVDGAAAAAPYVLFTETFDYPFGTPPVPWNDTGNRWQSSGYPAWAITSACGYWLGSFSATAAGPDYCGSYAPGANNLLKLDAPIDASRMASYYLSFVERHNLIPSQSFGDYDDDLLAGFNAGPTPSNLANVAVESYTGNQSSWIRQNTVSLPNAFQDYNYASPSFGFTTSHVPPAGTYGAWIDSVQIVGVDQPDLVVSSGVTASGSSSSSTPLVGGQPWYLKFSIANDGRTDIPTWKTFRMEVYIDGASSSIAYSTESSLASGTTRPINWLLPPVTAGTHSVKIRLDTLDDIYESDPSQDPELDNVFPFPGGTLQFTWATPPTPELVVDPIVVTVSNPPAAPRLAPSSPAAAALDTLYAEMGSTIDIQVTIRNTGTQDVTTPFRVGWYRDRATAPAYLGFGPDDSVGVASLPAGQSRAFHFVKSSLQAGVWRMYAFVDYTNAVPEISEANNVSGPAMVKWVPKTLVVRGVFQYQDSVWQGGGITSTYCNDIQLLEWDSPSKVDTLGSVAAQWATNVFEFPPIANVDDAAGGYGLLDLFIRVNYRTNERCWNSSYPDNWVLTMRTPQDSVWHFDYGGYTDVNPAGDTLDVGVIQPTSYADRSALHVFKALGQMGFGPFRSVTPTYIHLPPLRVYWGPGFTRDTQFKRPDTLTINGTSDTTLYYPDEWDDPVMLHEYGHYIAYVDGFSLEPPPAGFHEQWADSQTDSLAWAEGWADFYGALHADNRFLTGYGIYSDYGTVQGAKTGLVMDLENDSVTVFKPNLSTVSFKHSLLGHGARWQGCVAASLWDLYDSHDDRPGVAYLGDSLSEGFPNLISYLANPKQRIEDVHAFLAMYEALVASPNSSNADVRRLELAKRIFLDHGIYAGRDSFVISAVDPRAGEGGPLVHLLGASPNPFNPRTTIRFQVGRDRLPSPIKILIFDVGGRLVRQLRVERITRGVNQVVWDGKTDAQGPAASGVYFCELQCGSLRQHTRLVVLR